MWALHYNLGPPVASQIDPLILKVLVLFVHKDASDGPMKVLHSFVEDAMHWEKQNCEKHEVQLFNFDVRTSRWRLISSKRGRPMASVFLPAQLKDRITGDMDRFLSKKSVRWYHRHGVPYKRSYLFYGPPGSGKTSFIQVILSFHLHLTSNFACRPHGLHTTTSPTSPHISRDSSVGRASD